MKSTPVDFITPATAIARATVVKLARRGYHVAAMARTREDVEETIRLVEAEGSEGLVITGDVSKKADVQEAYRQIDQRWNRLDVVFANAGINGKWAPIEDKIGRDS